MGIRNFYKTVPPLFRKCRLSFAIAARRGNNNNNKATSSTSSRTSTTTESSASSSSGIIADTQYEHIGFDFNNMLYGGASVSHPDFVRHCVRQASKLVTHSFIATKSLYFALDGAAPAAKLLTQRSRRAESADSLRKDLLFYGTRASNASSIELTPGTELMASVHDALCYHACSHLTLTTTRLRAPKVAVYVDGSSVAGEGEFKLFAHIAAHVAPGDRTLIVSGDSDVVLLSLLSNRSGIDVLNTTGTGTTGYRIDALRREIGQRFAFTDTDAPLVSRVTDDFVLLTLLLGSDFTPALYNYNFGETLVQYEKLRRDDKDFFVYDRAADSIDVGNLLRCIVAKPSTPVVDDDKRFALFSEHFGSLMVDPIERQPNAESFVRGLQWSMRYLASDCIDDRYLCKQLQSMQLEDLAAWARAHNVKRTAPLVRRESAPLLAAAALIAVCPLRYSEVVPPALRRLHHDVWHELERATELSLAQPTLEPSPLAAVLDTLNARVIAAAAPHMTTNETRQPHEVKALAMLRRITMPGVVNLYERDESGKHLFAWPRLPRVLPDVKTRTGIVHRKLNSAL